MRKTRKMTKTMEVEEAAEVDAAAEVAPAQVDTPDRLSEADYATIRTLADMDASARKQGHSLVSILNKAAGAFYGISLT